MVNAGKEQNTQDHPNLSIARPIPFFLSSQHAGRNNWFHSRWYLSWMAQAGATPWDRLGGCRSGGNNSSVWDIVIEVLNEICMTVSGSILGELWGRLKMSRNKCYASCCLQNSFFHHFPPPNLTYFPDYVRNPDERPMSVSNATFWYRNNLQWSYCSHRF